MLSIDLTGRRALVAGVADDRGYGFAIAKALAEAGASIVLATWPPALNIFMNLLERGKIDESRGLSGGRLLEFEKIYPLDAAFTTLSEATPDILENKRYREVGDFSIEGLAKRLTDDFGERPMDIVVHSLANAPEVKKPLMETSRGGYLTAMGVSAYSMVAMVGRFAPLMRDGGAFSVADVHGERAGDPGLWWRDELREGCARKRHTRTRVEAGRKYGTRVNCISSAGPLASRAASAIGIIEAMVDYCSANSLSPHPFPG